VPAIDSAFSQRIFLQFVVKRLQADASISAARVLLLFVDSSVFMIIAFGFARSYPLKSHDVGIVRLLSETVPKFGGRCLGSIIDPCKRSPLAPECYASRERCRPVIGAELLQYRIAESGDFSSVLVFMSIRSASASWGTSSLCSRSAGI